MIFANANSLTKIMSIIAKWLGVMTAPPKDGRTYCVKNGEWVTIQAAADDTATDRDFNAAIDAAIKQNI